MMPNKLGCLTVLLLATASVASASRDDGVSLLEFDVYLNDKRVGTHSYEIATDGTAESVVSKAEFDYKILFFSAYRFRHSNVENWSGNCLVDLDATTNANGERLEVKGKQGPDGFTVDTGETTVELPECVMSFAYWNPDFLSESRLLNPQTGEYVEVSVEKSKEDVLQVRGKNVAATRYHLRAYGVDLKLWYSEDKRWLALESTAKGGHLIRYELS